MLILLNAIFPTETDEDDPAGYDLDSSAQLPAKVPEQDIEAIGQVPFLLLYVLGVPADVNTVQPVVCPFSCPASLLATKHAAPTTQENHEATCGTFARLPHSTQLHDQCPMLGIASCVSSCVSYAYLMLTSHQRPPWPTRST